MIIYNWYLVYNTKIHGIDWTQHHANHITTEHYNQHNLLPNLMSLSQIQLRPTNGTHRCHSASHSTTLCYLYLFIITLLNFVCLHWNIELHFVLRVILLYDNYLKFKSYLLTCSNYITYIVLLSHSCKTTMATSKSTETNDVFPELDVDRLEVNVIESLCFICGKNVSKLFDLFRLIL